MTDLSFQTKRIYISKLLDFEQVQSRGVGLLSQPITTDPCIMRHFLK